MKFPADRSTVRPEQLLPLRVPLQAVLGTATVEVSELANLSEGDVIVLDQETDRPLRLRVADS